MIGEIAAIALIENQLPRPSRARLVARAAARATPRGVVLKPVLLPLAVRPSPISGPSENSNPVSRVMGSGGQANV